MPGLSRRSGVHTKSMDEPYRVDVSGENYDTGEIKGPGFFIDHTDVGR
jgi:hypothetical protein